MRSIITVLAAAILAGVPAAARGQSAPPRPQGSIEFGVRSTSVSGDAARFQRFRDLGDGLFLDRARYERRGRTWRFAAGANHAGRDDQLFFADFRLNSKIRMSFQWDQVPLFNSGDTRTLYSTEGTGVLRLTDAMRQGIESGSLRLADVTGQARPFDVRSRRDIAVFKLTYEAARDLDVTVSLRSTGREGTLPWGATFGMSNDVEVAAPIDTRTTDLKADAEWAGSRGMLRFGYDGSWFDNQVPELVWDNPWRLNATATVPSQGRLALWPSSTLHAVTTAGALALPRQTRVTAHVTAGSWRQNEPLQPFTINPLVASQRALERSSAEGLARTLAMNYTATSRPARYIWLNARFRYYDFDNRTPEFHGAGYVRLDSTVRPMPHSRPLGYQRHNLDLDASFTPVPFTALRIGYGRDWTDRTYRIFERTTDDVLRASIDTTRAWLTLRGIYERSTRTGSGFQQARLTEVNDQPLMRHFDIADRDRDRVTGLIQITPHPSVGLSASAGLGQDDYRNSGFGLRDSDTRNYSFTLDLTPVEQVAAGVSYTSDRYRALQNSRAGLPDPLRNWTLDNTDRTHTVSATLDLLKAVQRTDLRLSYGFTRSKAAYVFSVAPNSTLNPKPLPPVKNELASATADFRYFLNDRVALGAVYWFDRYRVDDFSLDAATIDRLDLPGSLFLGYIYRPYTAHSGWLRVTYFW